jgi:hypothetical protein
MPGIGVDIGAKGGNCARAFVARDGDGGLEVGKMAACKMDVGITNARVAHLDQHLVGGWVGRLTLSHGDDFGCGILDCREISKGQKQVLLMAY